jgi:hypothetical protein
MNQPEKNWSSSSCRGVIPGLSARRIHRPLRPQDSPRRRGGHALSSRKPAPEHAAGDSRYPPHAFIGAVYRAQSILCEDDFAERFIEHVKGNERIAEIPKSQRFVARPPLHRLFGERELRDRDERDTLMAEAVEQFGYTQIAEHLGLHFSSISRVLRARAKMQRK